MTGGNIYEHKRQVYEFLLENAPESAHYVYEGLLIQDDIVLEKLLTAYMNKKSKKENDH